VKKLMLIALAGFLTIGSAAPVRALGPLNVNAELPVYSKYIWRGMNNTNDWVLQPSLGVGFLGFTANVWGNTNLTDVNGNIGQMNEWDYTLAYGFGLPFFQFDAGVIYYNYPRSERNNTAEVFLSAKANVILAPVLAVFKDVDKYKGTNWAARIGHGKTLGESTVLFLTAGLGLGSEGFISGYYAGQSSAPTNDLGASANDFALRLDVPFHPIPFLTITPSVTYASLLGDGRDAVGNDPNLYSGQKENVFFGLVAAFNF
jgi:hypothetical protein